MKCKECGVFVGCGHIYASWCHRTAVCLGRSVRSTPTLRRHTAVRFTPNVSPSYSRLSLLLSGFLLHVCLSHVTCSLLPCVKLSSTCLLNPCIDSLPVGWAGCARGALFNWGSNRLRKLERMRPVIYPDGLLVEVWGWPARCGNTALAFLGIADRFKTTGAFSPSSSLQLCLLWMACLIIYRKEKGVAGAINMCLHCILFSTEKAVSFNRFLKQP